MTDSCSRCDSSRFVFRVSEPLRSYAASQKMACCPHCLLVEPETSSAVDPDPQFEAITDGFPDGDAGEAMVLLLSKLESLALNRTAIEALSAHVETAGADVFLTLDRVIADESIDPVIDVERRREQLAQLLD